MLKYCYEPSLQSAHVLEFTQNFTYVEDSNLFLNIAKDFGENSENLQNNSWLRYWERRGNEIILQQWVEKYKNYLADRTEDQEVPSEQSEQQICENRNHDDTDVEKIPEDWQTLWKQHYTEVCHEQFAFYSSVFYNYFQDFLESVQCDINSVYEYIPVQEAQIAEEITAELQQLELLGLPKAFGSGAPYKKVGKRISKLDSATNNKYLNESDGTHSTDLTKSEKLYSESLSTDDESGNSQEEMGKVKTQDLDVCKPEKEIVTKKKNRKLRKAPKFMQNERNLLKYWRNRFTLFLRFDEGIRLDRESWFSVTPEKVATHIAERFACDVIVDGFCGCGGNAIQFAKTCRKVIAIDIDPVKVEMAKHNAKIYNVADKIDFIVGDFLQLSESMTLRADVVFLSPPWGGPGYKKVTSFNIEKSLQPVSASELMAKSKNLSENVVFFLPRNSNIQQIIKLAGVGKRSEVVHNYLDTKLVAICAIYGDAIIKNE